MIMIRPHSETSRTPVLNALICWIITIYYLDLDEDDENMNIAERLNTFK